MTRNLHITIHEGPTVADRGPNRLAYFGGRGSGGNDPTPIEVAVPPPTDPTEPEVAVPPPTDPKDPEVAVPPPTPPNQLYSGTGAAWPAAGYAAGCGTVQAFVHTCDCEPRSCCCGSGAKEPSAAEQAAASGQWSGFVIVRLLPALRTFPEETLHDLADSHRLNGLASVLRLRFAEGAWSGQTAVDREDGLPAKEHVLQSRPLIDVGHCEDRQGLLDRIDAVERWAARTRFKPRHSLASYWRIDGREHPELLGELVERLQALSEVELAYPESLAIDPSLATDQEYLEPGPLGIGARWAWERSAALTERVRVCDLEQGWHTSHDAIKGVLGNQPFFGDNRAEDDPGAGHHGTAVVGELAGQLRIEAVTGQIANIRLASHYRALDSGHDFPGTNGHVSSAIFHTVAPNSGDSLPPDLSQLDKSLQGELTAGDVLLLEVQRAGMPVEIADPADRDAIRLASALGVIVVEAAGNGAVDLDLYRNPYSGKTLNRREAGFVDSGAIVVGAAYSPPPHDRATFSCYGSRLDCFAWGDSVTTCGYGDLSGSAINELYTNTFAGTSSASPMIAGAAALVQAFHREAGDWLGPIEMRELLSDPAGGTPQGPNVPGHIGIMPDLGQILGQNAQIAESLYMRKRLGDGGSGEHPGNASISSSPDLLLWTAPPKWTAKMFGEGPEAHLPAPGVAVNVAPSKAEHLYVRLRNRGGTPGQAQVKVYSSPAATLITPDRWSHVGDVELAEVPVGDTLTVCPKRIPWNKLTTAPADQPPPSFLAVYRAAPAGPPTMPAFADWPHPLPPGPPYFDWREFRDFLRGPDVAWRNVHAVAVADEVCLPFLFSGTPDRARRFDFEIVQRLPKGAAVTLEDVDQDFLAKLAQGNPSLSSTGGMALKRRRTLFSGIRVPTTKGELASLRVRQQDEFPLSPGHSLAVRQLWSGQEVGRITWWFVAAP